MTLHPELIAKVKVETARYPSLEGRGVIVTGGGSGIGASLVEHFCAQGCKVGFLDLHAETAAATVEAVDAATGNRPVMAYQGDVDGKVRAPADEFLGAVQRVHEKKRVARIGWRVAGRGFLLGNTGDMRELAAQSGKDDLFAYPVGFGYGRLVGLVLDRAAGLKNAHYLAARGEREMLKRREHCRVVRCRRRSRTGFRHCHAR